jgi:hypothetical protein
MEKQDDLRTISIEICQYGDKMIPKEVLIPYYERALRWGKCNRMLIIQEGDSCMSYIAHLYHEDRDGKKQHIFTIGAVKRDDNERGESVYTFHS